MATSNGSTIPPERSALPGVVAGALALAVVSATIAWRDPIVAAVPGIAGLYGFAGPAAGPSVPVIAHLSSAWDQGGLRVAGTLTNAGRARIALPPLRIAVRDDAAETLYSWTAPAPQAGLGPGESVAFSSRLDKPVAKGRDVAVGFVLDPTGQPEGAGKEAR